MGERKAKQLRREERGRLDHILPRGYLDGFTDPTSRGQLSVFDCQRRRWFDSGTSRVAAGRGFYDYSVVGDPDQTADRAFEKLESDFPIVRRELEFRGFSDWRCRLDFLLTFAQMLRARSRLFRDQDISQGREQQFARVEEVIQRPIKDKPGEFQTGLRYSPMRQSKVEKTGASGSKRVTESVLCSAASECGLVPPVVERNCTQLYLERELAVLPNAVVVGLGGKAHRRMRFLRRQIIQVGSVAPPGCNQPRVRESWRAISTAVGGLNMP